MQADAAVRCALDATGTSRLVELRGAPPLVPRATGAARVHLVGAAAGPLPGDRTALCLDVGPGACLVVGSVGATLAQPGPHPGRPDSAHLVQARVGAGATLVVLGQPVVAVAGCRHRVRVEILLGPGARLVWTDRLVAGRSGQPSGRVTARLGVRRQDGPPVLHSELAVGPDPVAAAVLGGARCVGSALVVRDAPAGPVRAYGPGAVLMPLAVRGAQLGTALGAAHEVTAALDRMLADALGDAPDLLDLVRP